MTEDMPTLHLGVSSTSQHNSQLWQAYARGMHKAPCTLYCLTVTLRAKRLTAPQAWALAGCRAPGCDADAAEAVLDPDSCRCMPMPNGGLIGAGGKPGCACTARSTC